jgi:potassium-transporting ATPase potassium-binding subunit
VSPYAWIELAVFLGVLTACAVPLGRYIDRVFSGERVALSALLVPVERLVYRALRVDPLLEMRWPAYAVALLVASLVMGLALEGILRAQVWLPLNPQHFPSVPADVAWNAAISFLTTTDWQVYAGENTLGYLSQMSLAWMNFMAAAVGLAVVAAFIRGLVRTRAATIGNFWVDLTRGCLYVLLPLSFIGALLFATQGIQQNLNPFAVAHTLEGTPQTITAGPMASQEIVKLLGGNGGGFVAANSASPNENPTPASNFMELVAMLLLPAALPFAFGRRIGAPRQAWVIYGAMCVLLVAGAVGASLAEGHGNPLVHELGVLGPNLEGKEARFGAGDAGISLAVATDSTNGASNFAYESLLPLSSFIALANMQTSEVIFGGVGTGLTGMLLFVILTVFIAGLMVGRTPEYLGKKIERREIQLLMFAVLAFPLAVLLPTSIAVVFPAGKAALGASGPEGFSEVLYAFTSTSASNGSAFGGLSPTLFYNVATGIVMLAARFLVIIPTLAVAGSLAAKPRNDATRGTLRTDTLLFAVLLVCVIGVVGALTFVPADALGPLAQHLDLVHRTLRP